MPTYLAAIDFLDALATQERDYDIPGVGMVRIRGLTQEEAHRLRIKSEKAGSEQLGQFQIEVILTGLVHPQLTEEHIDGLRHGRFAVVSSIADAIVELSGMDVEAPNVPGGGSSNGQVTGALP